MSATGPTSVAASALPANTTTTAARRVYPEFGLDYPPWNLLPNPSPWPPPELGYDPCDPGRWKQEVLNRPFNGYEWRNDDGDPWVSMHGDLDCYFFKYEGVRFLQADVNYRSPISIRVDWGDGTSSAMPIVVPGCDLTKSTEAGGLPVQVLPVWRGKELAHHYRRAGTYTAKVTIVSGKCAAWTADQLVTNIETKILSETRVVSERLSGD